MPDVSHFAGFIQLSANRLELRQPDLRRGLLECDRNFHAKLHAIRRTLNDVGNQARTFVEIDPGNDVGNVGLEGFRRGAPAVGVSPTATIAALLRMLMVFSDHKTENFPIQEKVCLLDRNAACGYDC